MDNKITENAYILTLFKLEAIDYIEDAENITAETMLIGFFDSIEMCNEVEKAYRNLPGFCLQSCSFATTPFVFPLDCHSAIDHIYYVQGCITSKLTGEETKLEGGVFLTEEDAEAEKKACRQQGSCPLPATGPFCHSAGNLLYRAL